MAAPDDSALLHAHAPYDAAKAHQYYEEHKQLKGRTPGAGYQPKSAGGTGQPAGAHPVGSHPQPSHQQLQAHAQARVSELTARLNHLKAVLARLVQEAQKRSGAKVSPTAPKSPTKTAAAKKASQLTPAQKARNHKNYVKNKSQHHTSTSTQVQSLESQIKSVHTQIAQIRQNLKNSVSQARQHASQGLSQHPQTAPKGR